MSCESRLASSASQFHQLPIDRPPKLPSPARWSPPTSVSVVGSQNWCSCESVSARVLCQRRGW